MPAKRIKSRSNFLAKRILLEVWPLITITAIMMAIFARMSRGSWESIFLYNGDSLILPIVVKSILHHQFELRLSSQLFLFPEGFLYSICWFLTDSVRWSLILNGLLNVLILYGLFRALVGLISKNKTQLFKCSLALMMVGFYLLFVWLEPAANANTSAIATFYLLTDYYYGVIVAGLLVLVLMLWQSKLFTEKRYLSSKSILIFSAIGLINILTTFSDPLYVVQFYLPMLLSLCVLWLIKRLDFRQLLVYGSLNTVTVIIGYGLRKVASKFIEQGIQAYIHPGMISQSLSVLHLTFEQMINSLSGLLKLIIISLLVVLSAIGSIYSIVNYKKLKSDKDYTPYIFLSWFAFISSTSLLVGFVISGTQTTRYLVPITIFPILPLLAICLYKFNTEKLNKVLYGFIAVTLIGSAILIANSNSRFLKMSEGHDYSYASCLEKWADGRNVSGVGNFWITRQLSLYSTKNISVIQIANDFTIHPWLISLDSYKNKTYSFVLLDPGGINTSAVASLGPPKSITICTNEYTIYNYQGTQGETILNEDIHASYEQSIANP